MIYLQWVITGTILLGAMVLGGISLWRKKRLAQSDLSAGTKSDLPGFEQKDKEI